MSTERHVAEPYEMEKVMVRQPPPLAAAPAQVPIARATVSALGEE